MKIYLPTFEDLSGSRTGSSACTAVSYRLCRTWPWTCGCFKPTLPDLAVNLSKSLHIKGQPNSVLVHYNPWVGQQLIAFVSHIIASKFGSKLWTRNSTSSFQSLVRTPSWFVFTINVISSLGQYQLRAWTYSQEAGTYNLGILTVMWKRQRIFQQGKKEISWRLDAQPRTDKKTRVYKQNHCPREK